MLSKKLQDAFNDQLNFELYSGYIYLSMAAYFEEINLPGFTNWMKIQNQEETAHAMKFYDYVCERGGKVILTQIDGPKTDWKSPLDAFEDALNHERIVTGRINDLIKLAREENDNASEIFLQWFISEQVEEEASVDAIIQKLKLVGNEGSGLFMIDSELASRVFTPPA